MSKPLSELTDAMLSAALKAGADAADALAVDGTSVYIDVLHGKLEHAERAEGVDIGLRVIIGRRQACVSSSDIRDATVTAMAERAVAMAREIKTHLGFNCYRTRKEAGIEDAARTADVVEIAYDAGDWKSQ